MARVYGFTSWRRRKDYLDWLENQGRSWVGCADVALAAMAVTAVVWVVVAWRS